MHLYRLLYYTQAEYLTGVPPELDAGQFFGPDLTHTNTDPIRPDPRFGADE